MTFSLNCARVTCCELAGGGASRGSHGPHEAAAWYEGRRAGLGREFVAAVAKVLPALADNPYLNSRRHGTLHIRWRYPERFPFRIIYRVDEAENAVVIVAVLHAARHDRGWHERL